MINGRKKPVHKNSAIERCRQWCRDNPGEYLSFEDLRTKFGVTRRNANKLIASMREEGLFGRECVYLVVKPAANDGTDYDMEAA